MVTTLYLIRHGETEAGDRLCYNGSTDVGLSGRGVAQIRSAAAFVGRRLLCSSPGRRDESGRRLAAVYCSGLRRSRDSAVIIAGPHRLQPIEMRDLGERGFGIWEGMTFAEIRGRYPEAFASWMADPLTYAPEGGESAMHVRDRVVRAMERIVASHEGADISVVAHGGVNRIILCHILGMSIENIFKMEQDYGAVNVIEFGADYCLVRLMNGRPLAESDAVREGA